MLQNCELSFEDAMNQLEEIVRRLEDGKVTLDESMQFFEQGSALKTYCLEKLEKAMLRLEEVNTKVGESYGQN